MIDINKIVVEAIDEYSTGRTVVTEQDTPDGDENTEAGVVKDKVDPDGNPIEEVPVEAAGAEGEDLFVPSPASLDSIDIHKFVDMLNRFRSSPSFSEGDTREQIDLWWQSLTQDERSFLYTGMLGITQIALGFADAKSVSNPHDFKLTAGKEGEKSTEESDNTGADAAIERLETPLQVGASDDEMRDKYNIPIVVGESGFSKKWRQNNAKRLHGSD